MNIADQVIANQNLIYEKLGDREPSTVIEAEAVLDYIRSEKGYPSEDFLQDIQGLQEHNRVYIEQVFEKKRKTEARYTKDISEQLYTSRYRFLYELIQNADDSKYTKARSKGDDPSITFRINQTHIIVDTNEDGFTRGNVEAICATGESSKKATALDDHIGEKGFGFKAVFAVAHTVHVQSGLWSFTFKHNKGEDGLGMVTPLVTAAAPLPEGVATRMTLTLTDATRRDYEKLLTFAKELPMSTILFLKKLRKIVIDKSQLDSQQVHVEIKKHNQAEGDFRIHQRTITSKGSTTVSDETETNAYQIHSINLEGMPEDDARKGRTQAKVELAFPFDQNTLQPKLSEEGQYVFAYLPLQEPLQQLQFLIQSDFITSANRESVIECDWNEAIRDGVAEVFSKAVKKFATVDHRFKYTWLDFLPTKPMRGLWKPLYSNIRKLLSDLPILQTWESRVFVRSSQLRQVPDICLFKNKPLFRDLYTKIYLAPEYDKRHSAVLTELGAGPLSWKEIIDLLQADIASTESRMWTTETTNPWHRKCAVLLLTPFRREDLSSIQDRLRRLPIIPLVGGKERTGAPGFAPGAPRNIYFPSTGEIPIPRDISLKLVDPRALNFPPRKELFKKMGVIDCKSTFVIDAIEQMHRQRDRELLAHNSLAHFRYLFHLQPNPQTLKTWIRIPIKGNVMRQCSSSLYFPSTGQYHTEQLLENPDEKLACFLEKSLVNLENHEVSKHGRKWVDWLQITTGARFFPALTAISTGFTPIVIAPVIYTILKERPEKFIGLLQAHWGAEYQATIEGNVSIREGLEKRPVLCELKLNYELSSTYLPHKIIREAVRRFNVQHDFPLLHLPVPLQKSNLRDWEFLEVFGVNVQPTLDLDFYLLVLEKKISEASATKIEEVTQIYIEMADIIQAPQRTKIKEFFKKNKAICGMKSGELEWKSPDDCIWKGPEFLVWNKPIQHLYGHAESLGQFFTEVLKLGNANYFDALRQLWHSSEGTGSQNDVPKIYRYLQENVPAVDWKFPRDQFSESPLILANGDWYKSSQCVWKSPCRLSDYVELSPLYPDLEDFFVVCLKIQSATPAMLVKSLIDIAKSDNPEPDEIGKRLLTLGRISQIENLDENFSKSLDLLRNVDFLPMKSPRGDYLMGIDGIFAISDHDRFGRAFADQDILLDFTLDQISILDPIFRYLDLADRYLTNAVTEVSKVGQDLEESASLSDLLRTKAYALCCCAAKFKSASALPDDSTLFDQLSELRVFTTDDFSTELTLNLKGEDPIVKRSEKVLKVHYEVENSKITLYLPRDRQSRKRCYHNQLPGQLCKMMGSSGAEHQVSRIINTQLAELDELLFELDITDVSWITKPTIDSTTANHPPASELWEDRDIETDIVFPDSAILEDTVISAGYSAAREGSVVNSGNFAIREGSVVSRGYSVVREGSVLSAGYWQSDTPRMGTVSVEPQGPSIETYAELLDQVIRFARWSIDGDGERPNGQYFEHVQTFGDSEVHTFHNNRIGAAGELYVYETLSSLGLPNFSLGNWQSGIRGQVSVHPNYQNLTNTREEDGADIVYMDESGQLSTWLQEKCDHSFPDINHDGSGGAIKYLIEVKTTPTDYTNTFYMTHEQYKLMKRHRVRRNDPHTVYVLMRVYNLSNENIDVKIYVDPWRFRDNELRFHTNKWNVTPV